MSEPQPLFLTDTHIALTDIALYKGKIAEIAAQKVRDARNSRPTRASHAYARQRIMRGSLRAISRYAAPSERCSNRTERAS